MKKILTVSIMAVMAVTAANAEIASRAYVDQQDALSEAVANKVVKTENLQESDYTTTNYPSMATAKAIAEAISGGANYVEKNDPITAGTATKITYDAKGLVTGGTNITLSDVSDVTATAAEVNALHEAGAVKADFEKLHAVTADAAELNYVDGVTSNIQTQLDAKQATLTPAQQSAVDSGITTTLVGKISSNETAINTLNGDDTTEGSVAKAVKDATDDLAADISGKADKATTLEGYGITDGVQANTAITAGASNSIVTYDTKGLVTGGTVAGALATLDEVDSAQIKDGAVASADIADGAVILAKLGGTLPTECTGANPTHECVLKSTASGLGWEKIQRSTTGE